MKQDKKPSQVLEGKVDYSLEEFLRDLWEEVKSDISKEEFNHLPEGGERDGTYREAIRDVFNFIYEICYLAVMNKQYLKLILRQSSDSERKLIKKVIKENKENIEMLHAILMKYISGGLNKGLTKRQATRATIDYSKEVISNWSK